MTLLQMGRRLWARKLLKSTYTSRSPSPHFADDFLPAVYKQWEERRCWHLDDKPFQHLSWRVAPVVNVDYYIERDWQFMACIIASLFKQLGPFDEPPQTETGLILLWYVPFIHSYLLRAYWCSFIRIVIKAAYGRPRNCRSIAGRGKFFYLLQNSPDLALLSTQLSIHLELITHSWTTASWTYIWPRPRI